MVSQKRIWNVLDSYDDEKYSVGSLGSHSSLDICRGFKEEFKDRPKYRTVTIAKTSREDTYEKYFRTKRQRNLIRGCVDECIVVKEWEDMFKPLVLGMLKERNNLFVPHRSFMVYGGKENINEKFDIPIFGNRNLLWAEERTFPSRLAYNQDDLMRDAGILTPRKYDPRNLPEKFDNQVIIKATLGIGDRNFDRNFPVVNTLKRYETEVRKARRIGKTDEEKDSIEKTFRSATVEDFVDGPGINFYFFKSPFENDFEPMGTDTRVQNAKKREAYHLLASPLESMYEQAFKAAERLVNEAEIRFPPGIIGPFGMQFIIDGDGKLWDVDNCFRSPGAPDMRYSPIPYYMYGDEGYKMSMGRRIAMEIRYALEQGKLKELFT